MTDQKLCIFLKRGTDPTDPPITEERDDYVTFKGTMAGSGRRKSWIRTSGLWIMLNLKKHLLTRGFMININGLLCRSFRYSSPTETNGNGGSGALLWRPMPLEAAKAERRSSLPGSGTLKTRLQVQNPARISVLPGGKVVPKSLFESRFPLGRTENLALTRL